jgi:hypothetical protein
VAFPKTRTTLRDAKPVHSAPLDTTTAFVAMEATRGPLSPLTFHSTRDLALPLGARSGLSGTAYDAVDVLLREGITTVNFSRVIGAGAAAASLAAAGPGGTVFTFNADSPGIWANGATGGLTLEIVNGPGGGSERQLIVRLNGAEVERSPAFTTRAAALAWGDPITGQSSYGTLAAGAIDALPAVAAAANLAGGLDGAATTSTDVRTALDRFTKGYGGGMVFAPFRTLSVTHTEVLRHCAAVGSRVAFLDAAKGLSVAAQLALVTAQRAYGAGADGLAHLGGIWGQYANGPGVVPGTTREVPWSLVQGGITARAERQEGHANVAPVGLKGLPLWATGVDRYYDEADGGEADLLFNGGVNVVVSRNGQPRNYTFRSMDDDALSDWHELSHARLATKIVVEADEVGEEVYGVTITGDGKAQGLFGAKLSGVLANMYRLGALYGEVQSDSFSVDTGPTQNTTATISARELHAGVGFRASPHGEFLYVDVAKVPTAQEV